MVRVLVGVLLLLALAGCGGHSKRARSIAEVKAAFRHHGIRLSQLQLPSNVTSGGKLGYEPLLALTYVTAVNVDVYPTVEGDHYYSQLTTDGENPHGLIVRNVFVSWSGPDLPAVHAAVNELK